MAANKKSAWILSGTLSILAASTLAEDQDLAEPCSGPSQSNEKRKAMIIDHIYLPVSDLKRSAEFYKKVLEPLGIDMPYKFDQPPMRGSPSMASRVSG